MKCAYCHGTGKAPGSVGAKLRVARKRAHLGLREMAAEMGISSGYLHDLEHGRRNWTPKLLTDYNAALDRAS